MPTFEYRCLKCDTKHEVVKQMIYASAEEECPVCKSVLQRVWTVPRVHVDKSPSGYYNHGVGRYIHHKSQVRDELNRIKDTTGRELVEVGTENLAKHVKPVHHEYEIPREVLSAISD